MAICVVSSAGGNWSSTGTWVAGVVPGIGDDVQMNASSGNVTLDGTSAAHNKCNSLDCTGYTGTLTTNSAFLEIAGSLFFSTTMTLAINTPTFLFTGSATGNLVTWNGHYPYYTYYTGSGSWKLGSDQLNSTYTSCVVGVSGGSSTATLDLNGHNGSGGLHAYANATVIFGTSAWTMNGSGTHFGMEPGSIIDLSVATLTFGGSSGGVLIDQIDPTHPVGTLNIIGTATLGYNGANNYNITTLNVSGGGLIINGYGTITNFNQSANSSITWAPTGTWTITNYSSTATGTGQSMSLASDFNCTNFSVGGSTSGYRPLFYSSVRGTQRNINTSGTVSLLNVDFRDINGGGTGGWLTGTTIGDCGGNSGITFSTPGTFYYAGSNTNMSDENRWYYGSGGTGGNARCILPQDTGLINNSSCPSNKTINVDHPRMGTLDFSAVTSSPTIIPSSITLYGDLIRGAAASFSQGTNSQISLAGLGSRKLDSTYSTFGITIDAYTGTYQLQSDYVSNRNIAGAISINSGTLDCNGFALSTSQTSATVAHNGGTLNLGSTLTTTAYSSSNSTTRALNMNACAVTLTGTGIVWGISTSTNMTLSRGTSTITITDVSATTKAFAGGGLTYNNVVITGASGAGQVQISGSNAFSHLTLQPLSSVSFASGANQTIQNAPSWVGSSGNLITLVSSSGTTNATMSVPAGQIVACDYLSLTRITASGATPFYAGMNSTNGGNNTNWSFTTATLSVGASAGLASAVFLGTAQAVTHFTAAGSSAGAAIGGSLFASSFLSQGSAITAFLAASLAMGSYSVVCASLNSGIGASSAQLAGHSSGLAVPSAIGSSRAASQFASTGIGASAVKGAATTLAHFLSTGTSAGNGFDTSVTAITGSAAGHSSSSFIGASLAASVFLSHSDGIGLGQITADMMSAGDAGGQATVVGIGHHLFLALGVGEADAGAVVLGGGRTIASVEAEGGIAGIVTQLYGSYQNSVTLGGQYGKVG